MKQKIALSLILLATPALGGCALQAAMAAAQLAQYIPAGDGTSNAHLKPAAKQACAQRAAQHGSVHIIDVEQRRSDRLIVWGSTTDAQQRRRTFECHYGTALVSFKLREIGTSS
ncbi:MAG: hypothetical protein M3438_03835 [Pseudomonadota bacterium]|nr:hypothetical protein [Sphingomonas sp.]MDQ3478273.1 hypothetical protein [Pseudomonadota bacterium]